MKTRILPALFGIAIIVSPLARAQVPTPTLSKITAATVYTDRAIVTRTASAELTAGEASIVLEKLPADLVDGSVQVTGRGTAVATILDVSTRITYTDNAAEANNAKVISLQEEIKALDKTLRTLNDRDATLQQQIALLAKIENAVAAPPGKDSTTLPKIEDMEKLMDFSQSRRDKLALARQALAEEVTDTANKRNVLQAQINQIMNGMRARRSYKTVTVRVSAAKAGNLDLTVAYTVPNASWQPAYDARLRADARSVELAYYGVVRQSTGEDWNNIALTLSTARPGLGGAAPKNIPWFVDVYIPTVTKTENYDSVYYDAPSPAGADKRKQAEVMFNRGMLENNKMLVAAPEGMAVPAIAAANAVAAVESATTSASFKIAAATSIPSDNTPQKVSITSAKLEAKLQYQATPALQETAYLSAYVTNSSDFPLLAGNANIFLDDAFVATSSLKTVMPLEKFQLALGADEGIAVKRRVVNRFSENTGLTGKGRRVTYEFLITVTNNKKTTERFVFKESLPISRNEKIVVNLLAPVEREVGTFEKPGKEVSREEDNTLVWRIDLKPGEKREIPLKFNVEYPGEIQVSGLE